ncbi:MAG: hypothetical protein IJH38_04085 [Clostridia bacterium]|nr:hypothetical protein [Clostridia bacterium]
MKGLSRSDPRCVRTAGELTELVETAGFLPFFAGEVQGFSAEERAAAGAWWTGDTFTDPWMWRETIAAEHRVAYGKFFSGRAGFISRAWLPCFANARRNGWDFDGKWQAGEAPKREKAIMEHFLDPESDGDPVFTGSALLATDLKRLAGFSRGGEKNFPGVLTGLQMQLYLVIGGFRRRQNKRGEAYGMAVSLLMAPESIWGYEWMSSGYTEAPAQSWQRIFDQVRRLYPKAEARDIVKLIGKCPRE